MEKQGFISILVYNRRNLRSEVKRRQEPQLIGSGGISFLDILKFFTTNAVCLVVLYKIVPSCEKDYCQREMHFSCLVTDFIQQTIELQRIRALFKVTHQQFFIHSFDASAVYTSTE